MLTKTFNLLLMDAVEQGNIDQIKSLIRIGADINCVNPFGRKPMHVAARCGHKTVLKYLLENGISMEEADTQGWTPLHHATYKFHLHIIRFLVDEGANINARTRDGFSPLLMAAKLQDRFSPLLIEAWPGQATLPEDPINRDILDFLIEKGAGINDCDKLGFTALHYAVHDWRKSYIAEKLVRAGAKLDVQDREGRTPLHYAARVNNLFAIKNMLEATLDLNVQDKEKETPLHLTCKSKLFHVPKAECIEYLLEAGADCDIKNSQGRTALHYIILNFPIRYLMKNDFLSTEVLKNAKNYTDIGDKDKKTAAHLVLERKGNEELARFIFQNQEDLHVEDVNGRTPLNRLIDWYTRAPAKHKELIRLAVKKGSYFKDTDYQRILAIPTLRNTFFSDVEFCVKCLVNKFNNGDLPSLYTLAILLPPIENMKVREGQIQDLKQAVAEAVKVQGFCDVTAIQLKPLFILSAESLIRNQNL